MIHLEKKNKENKFKIAHYLLFLWKRNDMDIGKEGKLKPAKLCFKKTNYRSLILFTVPIKFCLISSILVRFFLTCHI